MSSLFDHRTPSVAVEGFEGPLELLLELIEEQRLDILTVRLGDLAADYLARVQALPLLPSEEVAAFLVIGARLVLIKARSLLPQAGPAEVVDAETDEYLLRERLLEYQTVRERAGALRERLAERVFHREGGTVEPVPHGGDTAALAAAWQKVLALARTGPLEEVVTPGERYNVEERAAQITSLLAAQTSVGFSTLILERRSVAFAIVTFLALLDLYRRGTIDLRQDELFGEITVTRRNVKPDG